MIGVIAATITDVRLGCQLIEKHGIECKGVPFANSPVEFEVKLKSLSMSELTKQILNIANEISTKTILINCNFLAGAVDLIELKNKYKVVTPFEAYKSIATNFTTFGLISSWCQATALIEKYIININKRAIVIGIGNLHLVNDIEADLPAEFIVKKYSINDQCRLFVKAGAELVILGCTHLTYIAEHLDKDIPIFEPSKEMIKIVKEKSND